MDKDGGIRNVTSIVNVIPVESIDINMVKNLISGSESSGDSDKNLSMLQIISLSVYNVNENTPS